MASSNPVFEIAKFAVNDAFKVDSSLLDEFLNILVQTPGVADVWHGPELQDSSFYFVVTKWTFRDASHDYAPVKSALSKAYKEIVFVHFAHFELPVDNALSAPVTKLQAVIDVKQTSDIELFPERQCVTCEASSDVVPNEITPGARGAVEWKPRRFMVCIGWHRSLDRFNSEIWENPELAEVLRGATELIDLDLRHVKLTKL